MTHALGNRPARTPRVAGVDRRFYAFVLDRLLGWGLVALACWPAYELSWRDHRPWPGLALVGVVVLVSWLGSAALIGLTGASPGKVATGLRVVDEATGRPVGVGPALARGLALGLATVPTFGIGLAAVAWTAAMDPDHRRRGWHDRLAGSLVVDVRPAPAPDPETPAGPRPVVNLTAMRLAPAGTWPVTPTPSAPRADHSPQAAPPGQPSWVLAFDTGQRVPVDGLVLVGRRPEAGAGEPARRLVALPSADLSLSKTHAQVAVAADGALVVTDRGSTNGSMLTRQGVSRPLSGGKPATLLPGDVVRFGDRSAEVSREP